MAQLIRWSAAIAELAESVTCDQKCPIVIHGEILFLALWSWCHVPLHHVSFRRVCQAFY